MSVSSLSRPIPNYVQQRFFSPLGFRDCVPHRALKKIPIFWREKRAMAAHPYVVKNSLRVLYHDKQQLTIRSQIKRLFTPVTNFKIEVEVFKRLVWRVRQPMSAYYMEHAIELNQFGSKFSGACSSSLPSVEVCLCLKRFTGKALLLRVFLALLKQSGIRFRLLKGRAFISSMLFDERNGERRDSKAGLSPRGPFALRDAKGAIEPAAIVDRIGHLTSPVSMQGIVGRGRG